MIKYRDTIIPEEGYTINNISRNNKYDDKYFLDINICIAGGNTINGEEPLLYFLELGLHDYNFENIKMCRISIDNPIEYIPIENCTYFKLDNKAKEILTNILDNPIEKNSLKFNSGWYLVLYEIFNELNLEGLPNISKPNFNDL